MNNTQSPSRSNPSTTSSSDRSQTGGSQQSNTSQSAGRSQDLQGKASDAMSKLTDAAQQAGHQAKQAASSLASQATESAKGFLNQQVSGGADLVGHVADSARTAADSLEKNAPQLAGLVRGAADRVEEFSADLRGQSVDQLVRTASDFTRRQPALVFGLASLAGFFLFRVLKAGPSNDGDQYRHSETNRPRSAASGYGVGMRASESHGL